MGRLIRFLSESSSFFLLVIYLFFAGWLVREKRENSPNLLSFLGEGCVVGVCEWIEGVHGWFALRGNNAELCEANAYLTRQVVALKAELERRQIVQDTLLSKYVTFPAQVVNNSVHLIHNSITINKGSADGMEEGMGVVSAKGIVGVINRVSEHFSVVMPLLNPYLIVSCKGLNSDYFGSLVWEGKDCKMAILRDLPRYSKIDVGDTIVTSGYSMAFPEGMLVGVVTEEREETADNFRTLEVELFTNFATLRYVFALKNKASMEQQILESGEETQ